MATSYLVLFDADRIHDYVFATGRLKEIRGASEQVRLLTEPAPIRARSGLGDWSDEAREGLIYAGGAAGALQFRDAARARAFCDDLERAYRHTTRGVTSITAVMELVEDDTSAAQADAQTRAARALARRKAARPQSFSAAAGGVLRFCTSDRLHPAAVLAPDPDVTTARFVSEATARKRRLSFDYRRETGYERYWQVFENALIAQPQRKGVTIDEWRAAGRADQDLGSIGALAQARGYVALVHVDGDGIGRAIRHVVQTYGFAGYQRFSSALNEAVTIATGQALARAYRDRDLPLVPDAETGRLRRCLPFEVITIGGDDVVLVCTGEQGLTIAVDLARQFGTLVRERFELFDTEGLLNADPPSASVGVVIAHDSLPIVLLADRGHELLKSAKTAEGSVGGLDFHVVTTPSLDQIRDIREREYMVSGDAMLTRRPYTLEEAGTLLEQAQQLAPLLPNSKRADLYGACQADRVLATLNVLAVHTRLDQRARFALLSTLGRLGSVTAYPFGQRDERKKHRTALIDLLEAIEFVPEEMP